MIIEGRAAQVARPFFILCLQTKHQTMKNFILVFLTTLPAFVFAQTDNYYTPPVVYEYKVLTSIESIIPMGLGRSRLLESKTDLDPSLYTTARKEGLDSKQGSVKRQDIKVDELDETKLLNFYTAIGINFQNIASNDAMISGRLTQLSAEGWELAFVVSGVESDGGSQDGKGIYVTRFIFKRRIP